MLDDIITLGHGGGGQLTQQLLQEVVLPVCGNPLLNSLDDAVVLERPSGPVAFTSDSYVIDPLFFPGGDIGGLAACGTINDLAMQAAAPAYVALSLILEEGLPVADLRHALRSLAAVLQENDAQVVTGDTKVVERGTGAGMYINTTAFGLLYDHADVRVSNARAGDAVLVTGTMGDHGLAVMAQREELNLGTDIRSDVAALWPLVRDLLQNVVGFHVLRDPTRGGLVNALCDIARSAECALHIHENSIPVSEGVRGACQLLGLDPLTAANEGKAVIVCDSEQADSALDRLKQHPLGADAAIIGEVSAEPAGKTVLHTTIGGERILMPPTGEDLPRIC